MLKTPTDVIALRFAKLSGQYIFPHNDCILEPVQDLTLFTAAFENSRCKDVEYGDLGQESLETDQVGD